MKYYDTSFDNDFKKIADLHWTPWVGKDYQASDHKALIVGDSHYVWGDNQAQREGAKKTLADTNFTRDLVNRRCLLHLSKSTSTEPLFFTNTVLMINKCASDKTKEKTWFNSAFYNFIQRPMPYSNTKPKAADFYQAWKVFEQLVQVLQPKYVLFMGMRASEYYYSKRIKRGDQYFEEWDIRKIYWHETDEDKIAGVSPRELEFKKGNFEFKGVMVHHPSRVKYWQDWHNYIYKVIPKYIDYLHQ